MHSAFLSDTYGSSSANLGSFLSTQVDLPQEERSSVSRFIVPQCQSKPHWSGNVVFSVHPQAGLFGGLVGVDTRYGASSSVWHSADIVGQLIKSASCLVG